MLMTAIKSVFNFYMLCVQPLLGLFLVGYSIWSFSLIVVCPVSIYDAVFLYNSIYLNMT